MRPSYERPSIVRHPVGPVNKFGATPVLRPVTSFEGVSVEELVAKYGSPLYVFSERRLRAKVRELREELAARFREFTLGWSYKTNYLGAICKIFHQEGAWAEVVSGHELKRALQGGVPGKQILFNGAGKTAADLALAFKSGALVHIDHLDELLLAERVAAEEDARPDVAIRVNIAEVPGVCWDRFGFNLENGRALDAIRRIGRDSRLSLKALHCHIGTFMLDPACYRIAARAMGRLARQVETELGIRVDAIDLGGGFASQNTLRGQYLRGEDSSPSFSRYIEAIRNGLDEAYEKQRTPRLVLETGRALVDDSAILISTVVGNKRLIDGRRAVILDAGVNILPTAYWYAHDIQPAQELTGAAESTVFYGPLCMNIDVVRDGLVYPPLKAGQRVVISSVGAYNVTQWTQFICERPNVVLVSEKGETSIIRRAETVETLTSQEEMPPWLKG